MWTKKIIRIGAIIPIAAVLVFVLWPKPPLAPLPSGVFVNSTHTDSEAAYQSDNTLRLDAAHVYFGGTVCDIVFHQDLEIPAAGDGPLLQTEIGYRCTDNPAGPDNTDGVLSISPAHISLTSFIAISGVDTDYIPAHTTYMACPQTN